MRHNTIYILFIVGLILALGSAWHSDKERGRLEDQGLTEQEAKEKTKGWRYLSWIGFIMVMIGFVSALLKDKGII